MSLRSRLVVTLLFALDVIYLLSRDLDLVPYDDAYFFKRFALNFSQHGSLSWNIADGPVHGLTSQLYGAVALGLRAVAPDHFVLASKACAALCLIGCVWRLAGASDRGQNELMGFGLALLTFASPLVTTTLHTGMETALTLLVLTVALTSCLEHADQPRPGEALRGAAWCTLVYLCRPDAALIAVVTCVLTRRRGDLAAFVLWLACLLGLCLLVLKLYYGTALPLPFYAKTWGQSPYDAALRRLGASDKRLHLLTWAVFAAPLIGLSRPRQSRVAFALTCAGGVFVAYHALFTNEIMGYRARFYVPALVPFGLAALESARYVEREAALRKLPWLVAAAGLVAVLYVTHALPNQASDSLERLRAPHYVAHLLLAACLCFARELTSALRGLRLPALASLSLALSVAARPPRRSALPNDAQFLERSSAAVTTSRGVFDLARCLPIRTVYHSEIGIPGLVFPDARVVDLAGLMSEQLALEHPPFDTYCARDRPEAIFLPHKTYTAQNREIAASRCLRDYTRVISQSSSPLYVRRELRAPLEACARDVERWR